MTPEEQHRKNVLAELAKKAMPGPTGQSEFDFFILSAEPKKVYVVETGSGEWENASRWVHGIYLTEQEAVDSLLALREQIKQANDVPCPVDEEKEEWTEEESALWGKWFADTNWAKEMWEGSIYAYPVGVAVGRDSTKREKITI